jgi:hypothetical protein
MSVEKIQIRYSPVHGAEYFYQKFIMYTAANGDKTVIEVKPEIYHSD